MEAKFNPYHSSYIILDITNLLYQLHENNFAIKLVWIPSHKGIRGNELADETAKDAARCGDASSAGIPYREFKKLWKKESKKESLSWCRNEAQFRGAYYFNNYVKEGNHPW